MKLWYCPASVNLLPFSRWGIYIDCPYSQKDEAKAKGAKFDNEHKLWFISTGRNISDFQRWLPAECNLEEKTTSPSKRMKFDEIPAFAPVFHVHLTSPQLHPHSHISANDSASTSIGSASVERNQTRSSLKDGCDYSISELKDMLKSRGVKGVSNLPSKS
jgi:hypothetical protein